MATIVKIFKNNTNSDIVLKEYASTIPASGQLTIEEDEYLNLGRPEVITEITPLINSGDIVVNDGISDLTASDGIRLCLYAERAYIKKNGVDVTKVNTVLNFKTGPFDVVDTGDGETDIFYPNSFEDQDDDRLVSVKCVPGTSCIQDASLLVDDEVCFIKKEEC